MRASDAFTWYMERDPALRSTVVAIDWLDRAPDWDVLTERVDRLSRLMPSLRQHVVESPFGLTVPRWAHDPHFDLDWHLSRVTVPPPGTRAEVLGLARHAAMAAFDRARPLWEVTLVEGMQDGEAALIVKLHHALSDGVGVMRMLAVVADGQREPADLGEMPAAPAGEAPGLPGLVAGTLGSLAGQSASLAWLAAGAAIPAAFRFVRDPAGQARGAVAMARSVYRTAAPNSAALSPLMHALHRVARAARDEPSLSVTGAIAGALNMLPVGYVAGILKHVDFLASNVPGSPVPVYLAGSKITGMFAFGPTIGASVNTTLTSYDGNCDIGVNIDTAAVPDPEVLMTCLRESLAEIAALGG